MAVEAIFFDFDGTLADSVEVKTRAFAEIFSGFGQDVVDRVVSHHRLHGGMSRIEKFRFYFQTYLNKSLDESLESNLCQTFSGLVVDRVAAAEAIPGAIHFLNRYYIDTPCAIVSAAPEAELKKIIRLKGWQHYFKYVLGTPASKETNLRRVIHLLGVEPAKCIFFGDAMSDYHAARSCGVPFWGIAAGSENPLRDIMPGVRWTHDFNGIDMDGILA